MRALRSLLSGFGVFMVRFSCPFSSLSWLAATEPRPGCFLSYSGAVTFAVVHFGHDNPSEDRDDLSLPIRGVQLPGGEAIDLRPQHPQAGPQLIALGTFCACSGSMIFVLLF